MHRCLQYNAPEYTWSTAVHQSQTFPADVIYDQQLGINWPYTTLPAQHFRSSGLLCRRSDGLRDPALTSNSLDNRWRRICFDATTQHTQRSRDASWLCAIWICYWHWHWQEFDFTQSVYNLTFVSKMIVSNWQKKTSAKHETPEAIKQHNFLRREIKRKTEIQGILSCLSLREYWTQL